MASFSRLVNKIRRDPTKVGDPARTSQVDTAAESVQVTQGLSKAQLAYVQGLQRLKNMRLDPDLERAAAADLGRSYLRRFGEEEMRRLRRLVYGDGGDVAFERGPDHKTLQTKGISRPNAESPHATGLKEKSGLSESGDAATQS